MSSNENEERYDARNDIKRISTCEPNYTCPITAHSHVIVYLCPGSKIVHLPKHVISTGMISLVNLSNNEILIFKDRLGSTQDVSHDNVLPIDGRFLYQSSRFGMPVPTWELNERGGV